MMWEIDRCRHLQSRVEDQWYRAALAALRAEDPDASERFVQCLQRALGNGVAASQLTACLVVIVAQASGSSRLLALRVLRELITDGWWRRFARDPMQEYNRCLAELARGTSNYLVVMELGSEEERACCVDLLGAVAAYDPTACDRVVWYFERCLTEPMTAPLRNLLDAWVEYLGASTASG